MTSCGVTNCDVMGCMFVVVGPPPSSRYESSTWYSAENNYREREHKSSYGMSPDTTVQTEALELTKSQEKSKPSQPEPLPHQYSSQDYHKYSPKYTQDYSNYSSYNGQDYSKGSHDISACPKETQPAYNSHHSPVYGSEAGIINLSVKSSHNEEANTTNTTSPSPLKLTLKVPSVYNASSPAKPTPTSPPPAMKSETSKPDTYSSNSDTFSSSMADQYSPSKLDAYSLSKPNAYSSLRSLLEARKVSDLPTSSATSLSSSPMKNSDAESSASSPGPELSGNDMKKTECPYCGKNFQYRSSFRRHLKIHQGVYTHICAACQRKFTRKEHFVRHKCNRKPNIPHRSAGRVEMTPETMLPASKVPQPKVAYPPTLNEQQISSLMATAATYSPAKNLTETFMAYQAPLPQPMKEEPTACNESRRKKAQPRKLIVDVETASGNGYMDEDEDVLKVYESPVQTPGTIEPASPAAESPVPEDLSMPHNDHAEPNPHPQAHSQVKPIEIVPEFNRTSSDTISTTTGTYQIEQVEDSDKCIKVTKQSNYLKLKKEAQMVNGQLQFVCPTCQKVFHRSSNFSRHMRLHRGVFSYICDECKRGFYRREHFQKHKCQRRAMSRIWERKTKHDMAAGEEMRSDGENQNFSDISDEAAEGIEAGVDLSGDMDYEDEDDRSIEEGDLVVDESAGMEEEDEEDLASLNSPLPPPVAVNT